MRYALWTCLTGPVLGAAVGVGASLIVTSWLSLLWPGLEPMTRWEATILVVGFSLLLATAVLPVSRRATRLDVVSLLRAQQAHVRCEELHGSPNAMTDADSARSPPSHDLPPYSFEPARRRWSEY